MMCCYPCIVIDRQIDAAAFSQRPIAVTIKNEHKFSLLNRLAGWWRSRCNPPAGVSRSVRVAGDAESECPANQVRPRVFAGKWPGPADPLGRRPEQLNHGVIDTKQATYRCC